MMFSKWCASIAMVTATTFAPDSYTHAQTRVDASAAILGTVTRAGTASRGTADYDAIRQFILSHPGTTFAYTGGLDDATALPDRFEVTSTTAIRSAADLRQLQPAGVPGGTPGLPAPLPSTSGYNVGDTYDITVSNGGFVQSWGYTLESGSAGVFWDLTSYSVHPTIPTPSPPIGGK